MLPLPNLRTRKEALAAGETVYFTGKPCRRGHVAPQFVVSRGCCACRQEDREIEMESRRRSRLYQAERKTRRTRFYVRIDLCTELPDWAVDLGASFQWTWELEYFDGNKVRGVSNADYYLLEQQLTLAAQRYVDECSYAED